MTGKWSKSQKHGIQFEVERYEEVITPTREGIIAYLASGQIRGIGKKTAERIYDTFGQETLQVLDQEPKKLLTVRGISEKKLRKIVDSYLANRGARDVIAFLAPHGVSPSRAVRLYREYREETMDIVRNHPYRLCELAGIAFRTADKLAMSMGIDPLSPERIDQALLYTLTDAETKGHLCLEKHAFLKECLKLLDTAGMTQDMAASRAVRLIQEDRLVTYGDSVFKAKTAGIEESLAYEIVRKMRGSVEEYPDLDDSISGEERVLRFRLAPEQREAVKMGLTSKLCVITGGPGTGKTSVQRALLDLYKKRFPAARIVCCAPTGKAARRMEQSTGVPSATVHRVLGLIANEDGQYGDPETLDADLVLVDEVSMLDVYLAEKLFRSIPATARLILVGDSDQLPSVGPGAVLKEIIASGRVPVVRLDQVFRQKNGSRIAANAKLIRHGNLSLEYGPDFEFYDSTDMSVSAEIIESLYLQETARCGIDNVVLLSPYRQKTETGANALNQRLQGKVNPPADGKMDAVLGQRRFRTGDKVMQIKNCEDINNGDVGYITSITGTQTESVIRIDFGDGRIVDYENADLDMLDLGYACTVHKSQGSEYKSVIINLQCAHSVMLVRPLIYTAITRAKEKVLIVGERRALCTAIRRIDTEQRGTKLAQRIREFSK
jgi:exodeoxyribonuclease V alpha subunit